MDWVGQVVFSGMMLSSTLWGNITDKYGRRTGLMLCTGLTFYFGALSAAAPTFAWLLVLRGLVGFGVGGVPQSYLPFLLPLSCRSCMKVVDSRVTLYAEFLPSTHRAKCVVLIEVGAG